MGQILRNFGEVWERVGLVQRVILIGVLLGCAGATALLVGWASQPKMRILYSGLSPEDAANIVDKIGDVQYDLKDGGTTVYVPEGEVYATRLKLASQGLPVGDQAGYRILDQEKMGASPFSQRINYTRAIEGEIAKTIQLLECIVSARVHIAKPESTVFAAQKQETTATVVLRLHPGRPLGGANVAAIVHLVAGSVEGLRPQGVVVVDNQGNLLSGEGNNELAQQAGTFLDYKSQVERYLAQKAQDMLTNALGPGRASVQVDADIDITSISETTETYDPTKRVATREEMKSKSSKPVGGTEGAKQGSIETEETTVSEYQVTRTVLQKSELPGKITSISVAVFVDLSAQGQAEGEENSEPATAALTVADVEEIVRNVLGLSSSDPVKVVATTFHKSAAALQPETADEGMFNKDFILEIARDSSLGILVLGALIMLKILGGSKGSKKGSAELAPALEGQVPQTENLLPAAAGVDHEQLRNRITQALQENPEEVKRLFLTWAQGDKGGV